MFTWTTKQPVHPGRYWCRNRTRAAERKPFIVEFDRPCLLRWNETIWDNYEWAGPIPEPTDRATD